MKYFDDETTYRLTLNESKLLNSDTNNLSFLLRQHTCERQQETLNQKTTCVVYTTHKNNHSVDVVFLKQQHAFLVENKLLYIFPPYLWQYVENISLFYF